MENSLTARRRWGYSAGEHELVNISWTTVRTVLKVVSNRFLYPFLEYEING